jgi:hypothetical protein
VRLLVSLCNRTEEAPECLLVVDPDRPVVEPVPIEGAAHGVFGLAVTSTTIYAVFDLGRSTPDEPERSELRALDPSTLAVRWARPFEIGRDVHSIAVHGGGLVAVSTGTDELLRLDLDAEGAVVGEHVIWRPEGTRGRTDQHHLNAVAVVDEEVLVAGFGAPSATGEWRSAFGGSVRAIAGSSTRLEPLYHPHSICPLGAGTFAVCESPRRRVVTNVGKVSAELPGYARGIARLRGKLFVGTSRDRHPGEPLSIMPHAGVATDVGVVAICHLDATSLALERVVELAPFGREVYDIVEVPLAQGESP